MNHSFHSKVVLEIIGITKNSGFLHYLMFGSFLFEKRTMKICFIVCLEYKNQIAIIYVKMKNAMEPICFCKFFYGDTVVFIIFNLILSKETQFLSTHLLYIDGDYVFLFKIVLIFPKFISYSFSPDR